MFFPKRIPVLLLFAFLALAFFPSAVSAAGNATLHIKGTQLGSGVSGTSVFTETFYGWSSGCSDTSTGSCTGSETVSSGGCCSWANVSCACEALGCVACAVNYYGTNTQTNTTCSNTFTHDCSAQPIGEYWAYSNFSSLAFPTSPDTSTTNTTQGSSCSSSTGIGSPTWKALFNHTCSGSETFFCYNSTYGVVGSCYSANCTQTNTSSYTQCGVGSGTCCSGLSSCASIGASDSCCPSGGTPDTDSADCAIGFGANSETGSWTNLSRNYYVVNVSFKMANTTTCNLAVNAANVSMTRAANSTGGYCAINRTSLSDGNYTNNTVYIDTYTGSTQNWGRLSSTINVTLDPTVPSAFSYATPSESNNSWASRNYWQVNVTFTEANPRGCRLEVSGAANWTPANATGWTGGANSYCFFNMTSQSDGNYSYRLYVNDTAGNWNASFNQTVAVDGNAPTSISFVSATPSNNTWRPADWFTINATFAEANPRYCVFEVNGANYSNTTPRDWGSTGECRYNFTSQSDAGYWYKVYVNDTPDTWGASSSQNLTLDSTPPTAFSFAGSTPANDSYKVANNFTVNATFTEANTVLGACFFELYHFNNGTRVNYTMARSGTSCNVNIPSLVAKNYSYRVYANDTANNWNASYARHIYLENYTTTGYLYSESPYSIIVGASSDYSLSLNFSLNNTASAQMKFANITYSSNLPAGWALDSTNYQCGTIAKSASCTHTFTLTIPAGTPATTKTIFWKAEWIENDNTTHSPALFNSTVITVATQPNVTVNTTIINRTVNPTNAADITVGVVNATGNADLQNVSIYLNASVSFVNISLQNKSLQGCTRNSATNWSCNRLCGGSGCDPSFDPSTLPFNFSITVPRGTAPQNILAILNVSTSNAGYQQIPVNITVSSYGEWSVSPASRNIFIGFQETGSLGSVTINNTGNINLTFGISCGDQYEASLSVDGVSCDSPPSIFVAKQSSNVSNITLSQGQTANLSFNATYSNASGTPTSNYTTFFVEVSDRKPRVEYVNFSPAGAEIDSAITIKANITDDFKVYDALVRFEITPAGASATNYTPARVSGSANSSQGNFSLALNASNTATAGTYALRIYSFDDTGKMNSSNYSFAVANTTTILVSANQSSFSISSVTQSAGAWLLANLSLNNTGYAKAYYANGSISISGWNITLLNYTNGGNLSAISNTSTLANISIPAGTAALQYAPAIAFAWRDKTGASASNQTVISVTIESNPLLRFLNASNYSIYSNSYNDSAYFILDSYGNANAQSVNLSCVGSVCTTFNISFNESSAFNLSAGSSRAILLNVSIPADQANNTYNITIYANGTNANISLPMSIEVLPASGWQLLPSSVALYKLGGANENYTGITLRNNGNLPQSYSLSLNGTLSSAMSLHSNSSTISSLASQATRTIWLSLSVPNSTANYSGYLIADNGTQTQSIPITLNAYKLSVIIVSPSASSPTSQLSEGGAVPIVARVLIDDTAITASTSFNATVSSNWCNVTSYEASGSLWSITCSAPAITGSLFGNLNLTANYSIDGGFVWAYGVQNQSIAYVDTEPPQINSSSLPTANISNSNSIWLYLADNGGTVSWTNIAVYSPSNALLHSQNYTQANVSMSFTGAQLATAGDYAILVNSSDNAGNINNTIVYFEALDPQVLSGTLTDAQGNPISATLYFKRPNRQDILASTATAGDGSYSVIVGKRAYDFDFALGATRIVLQNTSINASTTTLVSADVVPPTAVTIPGSSPVKVVVAEPAVQYSSAVVNISFADSLSNLIYEGNLHLYKCSSWSYSSRSCPSGWTRVSGSSVDKATHRLSASISSFSAYAVVENYCGDSVCRPDLGETYPSCPQDCPQTLNLSANATSTTEINQTVTTTGAGGSEVSLQQYVKQLQDLLKNPSLSNETRVEIADLIERLKKLKDEKELTSEMLDEIKRTIQKAQAELGIRVASQNIYLELYAGESTATSAQVKNTLTEQTTVSIAAEGDISRFMEFTENTLTLEPQQDGAFAIAVTIPVETAPAVYFGSLRLDNGRGNITIPVNIRVLEPQEKTLDLKIRALTEIAAPGQNAEIEISMFNLGETKRIDVQLKLQLLDQAAEKTLQELEEDLSLENSLTATKTLQVPKDAPDGKYIIRALAYYQDKNAKTREATNIAYIYVQKSIFELKILGIPAIYFGAIALVAILAAAAFYYRQFEAERKKRYLEKIDFTKLPAPGARSGVIGKIAESNVRAFTELDKLSTHTLVAGATGSGKTVAAQVLVEEALRKGIAVVVFDPTAQWTGFLRPQKNADMLAQYKDYDMSPSEAQAFKGNIHVVKDPNEQIDAKKLIKPGEITVFALNKLKQTPMPQILPTTAKPSEAQSIMQKLAQATAQATKQNEPSEIETFVANSVKRIFESNLEETKQLRLILVYDEVHRLLPKFGGSGLGFTQIERAVREFRKWGVGLVLVSQVLSDFVGEIKANIGTEVQMRTKYEGDLDRVKLKYGEDTMKSIVKASIGTGMVQNSDYNHGRPYFVSFRPLLHNVSRLTDNELSQYEQYNEKIERYSELVNKLKAAGIDVFDIELELDLARDKLKKGTFNIVDIYLESLAQKIKAAENKSKK